MMMKLAYLGFGGVAFDGVASGGLGVDGERVAKTEVAKTEIVVHKCSDPGVDSSCIILQRRVYEAALLESYYELEPEERPALAVDFPLVLEEVMAEVEGEFAGYGGWSPSTSPKRWASVTVEPRLSPPCRLRSGPVVVTDEPGVEALLSGGVEADYPHLLITSSTTLSGGSTPFVETNPLPETRDAELAKQRCQQLDSECETVFRIKLTTVADPDFRCGQGYYRSVSLKDLLGGVVDSQHSSFTHHPDTLLETCVILLTDKHAQPPPSFEPGMEVFAGMTKPQKLAAGFPFERYSLIVFDHANSATRKSAPFTLILAAAALILSNI